MWAQLASALLGVWLMAAPALLGYGDPARTNDHIVGPLAASFAFVAVREVTRGLRWVTLLPGVWLLAAPWALGYGGAARLNSLATGLLLAALALVRGKFRQRYGGGWRSLSR